MKLGLKMAEVRDGQHTNLLLKALRLQILFFCFCPAAASLTLLIQNNTKRFIFHQDTLSEIGFFLTGDVGQGLIHIFVRHTAEGENNYTELCRMQQQEDGCSSNLPEVCVCEAQKFRYILRRRFQLKDTGSLAFVVWEKSRDEKTVEIVIILTSAQRKSWTTTQAKDNSTVLGGLAPSNPDHSNSLNLNIVVVLTCVAIVVCAVIVFIVAAKCLFRKYRMDGRPQQELFALSGNSASARTGVTGLLSTSFNSDRNLAPEHYDHTFQASKIEDESTYTEINSYDHGTYLSPVVQNLPEYLNTARLPPVT